MLNSNGVFNWRCERLKSYGLKLNLIRDRERRLCAWKITKIRSDINRIDTIILGPIVLYGPLSFVQKRFKSGLSGGYLNVFQIISLFCEICPLVTGFELHFAVIHGRHESIRVV